MSIFELQDGPLAVIGDVHGELDALNALLARIDEYGPGRSLVFVGDLTDRGPDSPGVLRRVGELIASGRAQMVLGNHELNLLRIDVEPKADNAWIRGEKREVSSGEFLDEKRVTSDSERADLLALLDDVPVALEREDLRVVHASWDSDSLADLTQEAADLGTTATAAGGIAERHKQTQKRIFKRLKASGLLKSAKAEERLINDAFPVGLHGDELRVPELSATIRDRELAFQNDDPLRVITSGPEGDTDRVFAAGGKWRHTRRKRWWQAYDGKHVAFGHYWRTAETLQDLRPFPPPNPFAGEQPLGPVGPKSRAHCLDYSVGRRFLERLNSGPVPKTSGFQGKLAALLWPEGVTIFDTVSDTLPR